MLLKILKFKHKKRITWQKCTRKIGSRLILNFSMASLNFRRAMFTKFSGKESITLIIRVQLRQ